MMATSAKVAHRDRIFIANRIMRKLVLFSLIYQLLAVWEQSVSARIVGDVRTEPTKTYHDDVHDDDNNNMNGDYVLSNTPYAHLTNELFPKRYSDYPHKQTQYVDVYSPEISTLYSQVYWKRMQTVSLPQALIEEFDSKAMAIVGFEVDQVVREETITSEGAVKTIDKSVPLTVTYNHHFDAIVLGKNSRLVKVRSSDPRAQHQASMGSGHGFPLEDDGMVWIIEDAEEIGITEDSQIKHSQQLGAANGGEFRKSFHGFPPGFAKVVQSPTSVSITPMQIDTWNREAVRDKLNQTFVPGPVPRNNLAPLDGVNAVYSGLLECPVTTRIQKHVEGLYRKQISSYCSQPIDTANECFDSIGNVTFGNDDATSEDWSRTTVSDANLPAGCLVTLAASSSNPTARNSVIFNNVVGSSVECGGKGYSDTKLSYIFSGHQTSLVDLEIEMDTREEIVTITMTGPSEVWFGVGFNATQMKDEPWAITIDGITGNVTERKLGYQGSGGTLTPLPPSLKVTTNMVQENGQRTVVVERTLGGRDDRYFTFSPESVTDLNFINAIGSTPDVQYHNRKTASQISVLPHGEPICICRNPSPPFGSAVGTLMYMENGTAIENVGFWNKCPPRPRGDLLEEHNPTCDIRTYTGGQLACHHMWSLLDADQEIPWQDQPLKYHLKFRIWYQEYDPKYHKQVHRTTWGIGSPVEYDVPQCAPGTEPEDCVHTITGTFAVHDEGADEEQEMRLIAAHFHCHAPTCLSVALYNNETGKLLCKEEPLYGGGNSDKDATVFDEAGFLAVPPCLWGDTEYGLEAPPVVGGQRLHAIKTANATYGHHGEMAWLQVLYTLSRPPTGDEYQQLEDTI